MSAIQQQAAPPPDLAAAIDAARKNPGSIADAIKLGGLLHDYGMHDSAAKMREHTVYLLHSLIASEVAPEKLFALLAAIYMNFVKKIETEEHTRACFQSWVPAVTAYARKFQSRELPVPLWRPTAERPWRAAFLLQNASVLGHTEAMLEVLSHRPRGMPWADQPVVYVLEGNLPALNKLVEKTGARIINMQGEAAQYTQRLELLRQFIARDGVSHLVWVSAPSTSEFCLAMRLAPAQIFWTLKFHCYRIPEVDGYVTYGAWSEERRIEHGEEWQVVPFMVSKALPAVDAARVAEARAKFAQHDVLFGTLARTEKINAAPFLDAVVRVLRENPRAGYLWTGRERHGGIQLHFEEAGVAERCHFIGWVETPLYARVLDVFLESFPFGCGLTGMQALEAGTAFLSYAAPVTQYGMHFMRPLVENGAAAATIRALLDPGAAPAPLLYPANADEYVALAGRLARDPEFRRAAGLAGQDYYRRYLTDARRMADRFFAVLADVKKPEEAPA